MRFTVATKTFNWYRCASFIS